MWISPDRRGTLAVRIISGTYRPLDSCNLCGLYLCVGQLCAVLKRHAIFSTARRYLTFLLAAHSVTITVSPSLTSRAQPLIIVPGYSPEYPYYPVCHGSENDHDTFIHNIYKEHMFSLRTRLILVDYFEGLWLVETFAACHSPTLLSKKGRLCHSPSSVFRGQYNTLYGSGACVWRYLSRLTSSGCPYNSSAADRPSGILFITPRGMKPPYCWSKHSVL